MKSNLWLDTDIGNESNQKKAKTHGPWIPNKGWNQTNLKRMGMAEKDALAEIKIRDMWELIGQHSQYMFVTAPPFFVTRLQSTVSNSFQEFKKPQFLHSDVTLTPPNNRGH